MLLILGSLGLWGEVGAADRVPPAFSKVSLDHLETFHRELTLRLVEQLQDPALRELLASRLQLGVDRIDLNRLMADYAARSPTADHQAFQAQLQGLDLDLRQTKGLQAFSAGLLALEALWPAAGPQALDWETVLLGVEPEGTKRAVTRLEAYDLHGGLHVLDPGTPPGVLVLMPGADRREVKRAAIAFLNDGLLGANCAPVPAFLPPAPRPGAPVGPVGPEPVEPLSCALLTRISLQDAQEPWWKGKAEVYAITSGIDPTLDRPILQILDLPYLQYAHVQYSPRQLVLVWDQYRFAAANLQLWEQDSGTNYQDLLTGLLAAASGAMAAAGAPVLAWIPALATAIIRAIPREWFRDNDDYLDTFYTLQKGRTYVQLTGAAGNAVINLEPFTLLPN